MKLTLVDKLCCPFDKHNLELKIFVRNTEGDILEGVFTCSHCKRYYPVIHGIPVMSPDEYREPALEAPVVKKWQELPE